MPLTAADAAALTPIRVIDPRDLTPHPTMAGFYCHAIEGGGWLSVTNDGTVAVFRGAQPLSWEAIEWTPGESVCYFMRRDRDGKHCSAALPVGPK